MKHWFLVLLFFITLSDGLVNAAPKIKAETTQIPAAIKSVFAEVNQVTPELRKLSTAQSSEMEKTSGIKPPDDFKLYQVYGLEKGKKTQIGMAMHIHPDKTHEYLVAFFPNMAIKKVIPVLGNDEFSKADFLRQFSGKTDDAKFIVGKDIKYKGKNMALAKKIVKSIELSVFIIRALYDKPKNY